VKKVLYIFVFLTFAVSTARAQFVIKDFQAEVTPHGDVILTWSPPGGAIISQYNVMRGIQHWSGEQIAEIHSPFAVSYRDDGSNLAPGQNYHYWLSAINIHYDTAVVYLNVLIPPPTEGLVFVSVPPTTAFVNQNYFYRPEIANAQSSDIEYEFAGPIPEGFFLSYIGGTFARIYWQPQAAGMYPITLVAKHKTTKAYAVQEFTMLVTKYPGTVIGVVEGVGDRLPISGARIVLMHINPSISYETVTDSAGEFRIDNVEAGQLYAYAEPPGNDHIAQWYLLGRTIREGTTRDLYVDSTLEYRFTLLPNLGDLTPVSGVVEDKLGDPVKDVRVSFVRKNNFIHIGDITRISNPLDFTGFVIDTSVYTASDGKFEVYLQNGDDYYTIVEKSGFLPSVATATPNAVQTNALEARAIRAESGSGDLKYRIISTDISTNTIEGAVASSKTGVSKKAVVVLVDSELKRGAGGGATYRNFRSTTTDSTGYYKFNNLSSGTTYSVLAVPLEPEMVPQYFSSWGGTSKFMESEGITASGSKQNIDLELNQVRTDGIGIIYGQVLVKKANDIVPAPGTLLFARDEGSNEIIGYAISDSTGWYSIVGLPSGQYKIHAESPGYGSDVSPSTLLFYTNIIESSAIVHFLLNLSTAVDRTVVPSELALDQNYPNPFNPVTTIRFAVPNEQRISLRVFNTLGNEVAVLVEDRVEPGTHTISFDAQHLPSGLYYYQLRSGPTILSRKMLLMK